MKGHAKASSAGSNWGVASSFASSRCKRLALLVLACALIAALTASSALAAKTHPYTGLSFGPDGTEATSFVSVAGVAVDPANGNVYVHDGEEGKIYKFDAAGNPLNFSGLGTNAIEGAFGPAFGLSQIAVAPPGALGGTAGDIYLANFERVLVFGPDGNQLGELSGGGQSCGVATDPAGHVFVGVFPAELIREYTPSANPVVNADKTGASQLNLSVVAICNVAADGLGNIYAADPINNRGVTKLAGINATSDTRVDPLAKTLAVDPANDDLYANRGFSVAQYSSAGELISTFGSGRLEEANGIAVNGTSGNVYVANGFPQRVEVFGPLVTLPTVAANEATAITASKATLNGTVNPEAIAVTDCKFEYSTDTSFSQTAPCEGAIPTDSDDHPVSAALSGLEADTTYHFRLAATNAQGTSQSEEQTFTTANFAATEEANPVAGTKATLHGTVLPEGETPSACFFEYGTTFAYGQTVACQETVPGDEAAHPVSAELTHLAPNGIEYHFRLLVERPSGTAQGLDKSFVTKDTVITGAASAINPPTATLNGTLNPEGIPYTECFFEYGPSEPAYGSTIPCSESPSAIGEGSAPVAVHADLSGLAFDSTYHYRLVGVNVDGSAKGKDAAFNTPGLPLIESEEVGTITDSDAELIAKVNPRGSATTYHLEYGIDTSYGQSTAEAEVGGGEGALTLTDVLKGLSPETTYHWHAVASNARGTNEGPDRTFTTFPDSGPDTNCPNQALHGGASAALPDCRAYEMVSPPQKLGEVFPPESDGLLGSSCPFECLPGSTSPSMPMQADSDGGAVVYEGQPFSGALSSAPNEYLSKRSADGWVTQSLSPLRSTEGAGYTAFSSDLARGVLRQLDPAFSPNAPTSEGRAYENLYLRGEDGSLQPLVSEAPPFRDSDAVSTNRFRVVYGGANSGTSAVPTLSHLIFAANDALTEEVPGIAPEAPDVGASRCQFIGESCNLYEWVDGQLRLINVVPGNAAAVSGAVIGSGLLLAKFPGVEGPAVDHAISADGSRIFWSEEASGHVYVRIDGEETLEIPNSGRCKASLPLAERVCFLTASADGSQVLLSDGRIYELNEGAGAYEATTDLTQGEGGFQGILGAAEDLSSVYFVDTEVLTGGEENANGEEAEAGEFNLYAWHEGTTTFVGAPLEIDSLVGAGFYGAWSPRSSGRTAQVSPDGRYLAFMSKAQLTGYDSERKGGGECGNGGGGSIGLSCYEVFEYDAVTDTLACPSCNPSGDRPLAESNLSLIRGRGLLPQPGNLTDNGQGRLFFESQDTLSPGDTNGHIQDVYEWVPNGVGKCERAAGCVSLISSGNSANDSHFVDATPSGDNAFFITREQLLPPDRDDQLDLYAARVGGGFAEGAASPCGGEACKGLLPALPASPSSGTSSFNGPANKKSGCRKPKKCHKQKKQRKHKHQSKKQRQRSAKHNRGGAR